MAIINVLEKIS